AHWSEELFGLMLEKLGKRLRQEQDFRAQLAGAKLQGLGRRLTDKELFAKAGIVIQKVN
ncbi:hypothetical protein LCGC14_1314990, partial [marine sediment metagenome]